MSIQQNTIKKFVRALTKTTRTGYAAANEAVSAATDGKCTTWSDLVNYFVDTVSAYGGTGNSKGYTYSSTGKPVPTDSTHRYLTNYCGIDLTNDDTGALTGKDAGGSSYRLHNNGGNISAQRIG